MILALDSSALVLLVNPAANPPDDLGTKQPVTDVRERVEFFIAGLTPADTLIVPAPVLAADSHASRCGRSVRGPPSRRR